MAAERHGRRAGHDYTIEEVRIDQLHTDVYQRILNMDKVNKLAANWDPLAVGFLIVSRRPNGDLYVVDGQHRAAAALRFGHVTMEAQVFEGLSLQQEAKLRIATNDRKSEVIWERFKARLVAEDPVAEGIRDVIESVGGNIRLTSFSGRDSFVALAAAEKLYNVDGNGDHLSRVMAIVVGAFGKPTSDNAPGTVLYSVSHLVLVHPEVDDERLTEKLSGIGIMLMNQRALHFRGIYTGSRIVNWYRAAVEAYNYKLGAARRLQYKTPRARTFGHPDELTEADVANEVEEDSENVESEDENGDDNAAD